jgi:transcriptional regulator with XRE-family HTH domain
MDESVDFIKRQNFAVKGFVTPPDPSVPKDFLEEFIAQQGVDSWEKIDRSQRSRFNTQVVERIKQFKKDTKGLISRQELADLLGVDNDYLRGISRTRTYEGFKRNPKYDLIMKVLGEPKKIYRPVTGYNLGYYKKPSAADIKKVKNILDGDVLSGKVINRVNTLAGNKKFMNMLRNTKLTEENFLPKAKAMFPNLDLTDKKLADAILLIARASEGANLTGVDLKNDKRLSKKLLKQFETAKWGNPFHEAAYKYASGKIDEQLGSKVGTFKSYQVAINKKLNDLGIDTKNYNVDEFVGVSIGGKQKTGPYSTFTQVTDAKYNQGPGANYQGKLSQASTELSSIIDEYGSDSKQAKNFVKKFNETTALNHEKKYNTKVAKLDLKSPEKSFGKKRFKELGSLGEQLTSTFEEKGFGYEIPKGAQTQKETVSALQKIPTDADSKTIAKKLASFGFKCSASEGGACDNPMNYLEDIKKQQAIAKGSGNAAASAAKKLSAGRAIFREVLGPAALGFELAAAVPITYLGYKAGLPPSRIIADATYGLFGDTETARLKKIAVKEGIDTADIQKALDFEKASGAMQTLAMQEQDFRGPDDEMQFPQQYEKGEEDFYKAVGAFRDKEGNISKEVFEKIMGDYRETKNKIAEQDAALAAEREAKIDRTGIGEYLTDGIMPEEETILPFYDFQEESTRMDYSEGSPKDPSRRTFLKFLAGIASLPIVGKFFKGAKSAKVVKLANTSTTMPEWFPAFVEKAFERGVVKKIDADIRSAELPELPGIEIIKHDDGRVFVEGKNEYGKRYEIEYEPPGYELIDEKTGKAVKKKGEFIAQEEVPVNVDPDGNADFDVEVLDDLDQILGPDTRAMEEFATGKPVKEMKSGEFSVGKAEADADVARDLDDYYED